MAGLGRDESREVVWRRVLGRFSGSGLSVRAFCRRERLTEASFYAWRRTIAQRDAERAGQARSRPTRRQPPACRNTVAKAMREMGLKSRVPRQFTPTTTQADPTKTPAPNTLDRDFHAAAPNLKWTTDITYLWTAAGWVYLAVVMDLFSRKIVGWSLGASLATELVADALRKAIESRRPDGKQLLHHSDRGCQYTSDAYQQTLRTLGIACSMSRTGNCYDNAAMERFFWSLKYEWTNHETYETLEDARLSVFRYIETFYCWASQCTFVLCA